MTTFQDFIESSSDITGFEQLLLSFLFARAFSSKQMPQRLAVTLLEEIHDCFGNLRDEPKLPEGFHRVLEILRDVVGGERDADRIKKLDASDPRFQEIHLILGTKMTAPSVTALMEQSGQGMQFVIEEFRLSEVEALFLLYSHHSEEFFALDCVLDAGLRSMSNHYASLSLMFNIDVLRVRKALAKSSRLVETGLVNVDVTKKAFNQMIDTARFTKRLLRHEFATMDEARVLIAGQERVSALSVENFAHFNKEIDVAAALLRGAIERGQEGVNLMLYGPVGTGKTELAAVISAAAGVSLRVVGEMDEDGEEPDRRSRLAALRLQQRVLKHSMPAVSLVDEMEDLFTTSSVTENSGSKIFLNKLMEENPRPIIWIANSLAAIPTWIRRRMSYCHEVGLPPKEVLLRIFDDCAQRRGLTIPLQLKNRLASLEGLTPSMIAKAINACDLANQNMAVLEASVTGVLAALTGAPATKKREHQIADFDAQLSNATLNLSDFTQKVVASQQRAFSMLLSGPPGTGKSAFARYLADQLQMKTHVVRASDILGSFVGETERAMAAAFQKAKDEDAVLVFDEADSLLFDRKNAMRSFEVSHVNEMLSQMEDHPLPFICSTNAAHSLDMASLRRFTFKVDFDFLKRDQLRKAFEHFFGFAPPPFAEFGDNLTPADFAVVKKKLSILGGDMTASVVFDALQVESDAKAQGGHGRRVGFRMIDQTVKTADACATAQALPT